MRFLVCAAYNGREGGEELYGARIPSLLGRKPSYVCDLGSKNFRRMRRDEYRFSMGGRKGGASGRRSRLEEKRRSLGRRVDDVFGTQLKVFALVIDSPNLVRVRVGVVLRIRGDCVCCP